MALSLLESIRKLIRQDTVRVGRPVGNLHGAVRTDLGDLNAAASQTWLRLTITGRSLPTLSDFLDAFADTSSGMSLEVALDGAVALTAKPNTVELLRTVVSVARTVAFNLEVTVPTTSAAAAVYVDGVLARTVYGTVAVPVTLSAGKHTLYVVLAAPSATVTVPTSVLLTGETDMPGTPTWESVTTGYLDERSGGAANTLRWYADPQVGHYRVMRRTPELLGDLTVAGDGEVLAVSDLGANDTYAITLNGDHVAALNRNTVLLAAGDTVGIVVSATLNASGDTVIACRLPVALLVPPTSIVGMLLARGTFTELTRVTRVANTPVVEYIDSAVTKDTAYEYAIQATGLADETVLSALSAVRYLVTGDVTPPGSIAVVGGYPKVLNRTATVKFSTPTDLDYAGVHVYFRKTITNSGASYHVDHVTSAIVTTDTVQLPTSSGGLAGYTVQFGVTNYESYAFHVQSNTSSTITLTETLPTDLATAISGAGSPVALTIFKDTQLKTDAGSPGRLDELTFDVNQYGSYYFATFDRSGNEQAFAAAVLWTYTAADDAFSSPPVLAIRQLTDAEQAYFTSYADTTKYAVIEVWANDPQQPVASQFSGVTIYYQRIGQDASAVTLMPVPSQSTPFPNVVTGSGAAVLDNPSGTRSRFILVNRQYGQVRLWTANTLGQTSDITTFTADLNTTASVTVETYINPLDDTAKFVAVVDDDTQGFSWQVDAGTVTKVDTRTVKRVEVSQIPLALGQRKTLSVIPYTTYTAGPPVVLSVAGESVVVDLVRTPRSYLTFDSKDAQGNRSATYTTSTFAMTPAVTTTVTGRTGTVSAVSGAYRLTDSGSPGWTANQYQSSSSVYYYLVLRPAGNQNRSPIAVRVSANGTSTVDTGESLADYVGIGSVAYEIVDGAVLWRKLVNGTPIGAFKATLGSEVFEKTASFELEFYATKTGSYPESARRVLVDADTLPSLSGFGYSVVTTGGKDYLVVGFGEANDDATTWEVYEKKGGWPTVGGSQPSAIVPPQQNTLDRAYMRFSGPVYQTSYSRRKDGMTGGDIWYAVAVAKNSFGELGVASTATYTVGGTLPAALTDLVLTPSVGASTMSVAYPANSATSSSANVTITAVRSDNANTAVSATRTVAQSPYALNIGETIVASGGTTRTWTVTATLASGNTLTRTVTLQVANATSTNVTATAYGTVYHEGACFADQCGHYASSPHARLVAYSVSVNGTLVSSPSSPYYVNIQVTNDASVSGGTNWTTIAYGLRASDQSYIDTSYCEYHTTSGTAKHWTYRVVVTDGDGTPVGVTATTSRVDDTVAYCGGSGGNDF